MMSSTILCTYWVCVCVCVCSPGYCIQWTMTTSGRFVSCTVIHESGLNLKQKPPKLKTLKNGYLCASVYNGFLITICKYPYTYESLNLIVLIYVEVQCYYHISIKREDKYISVSHPTDSPLNICNPLCSTNVRVYVS